MELTLAYLMLQLMAIRTLTNLCVVSKGGKLLNTELRT